jgi:hypothetical protein
MVHDTQSASRPTTAEMMRWERPLLQTNNGMDALFALSKLAGVDAYQPRNAWQSEVTRSRVRKRRHLLFAFLRRELKLRPDKAFTRDVPLVLCWMLLATGCPFSPHHRRELVECIERDPAYRHRQVLLRLPEKSRRRERAQAIELLYAAMYAADTSRYVNDHSRGWWNRVRGWLIAPTPRQLQPYVNTQMRQ